MAIYTDTEVVKVALEFGDGSRVTYDFDEGDYNAEEGPRDGSDAYNVVNRVFTRIHDEVLFQEGLVA